MRILRVNTQNQKLSFEEVPEQWQRLGGRALIARFMLDEVPPTCEPLGPHNKLLWAPGLLVGHMLSSCDRISIGGKSPLTGGINESNTGGMQPGGSRLWDGRHDHTGLSQRTI
jgi:aldehyde:ferredoxin oxidoreductase